MVITILLEFEGRYIIYGHHNDIKLRPLVINKKLSCTKNPSLNDNLIIHGDNLHALKSLMPLYVNKIKCIFIDPPYNTGSESWAYNDNVNSPLMQSWISKTVEREFLDRHDRWLCMMMPRLKLLKELLSDDGVIFISIDDNEVHNLRQILDEIFLPENFLGMFIWKKKYGGGNDSRQMATEHDYILCYSKNNKSVNNWFGTHDEEYLKRYKEKDDVGHYFWDTLERPGLTSPINVIIEHDDKKYNLKTFRTQKRIDMELKSGEIRIKTIRGKPSFQFKQRLNNGKKPRSILNSESHIGSNATAKQTLKNIFKKDDVFPNPKPVSLIKYLTSLIVQEGDIVLDSFAGSGTTGHAVLELNESIDNVSNKHKFILIECEDYAKSVTAKRINRVIKGVKNNSAEISQKSLGGSFTFCTLGDPITIESMLSGKNLPNYNTLQSYIIQTSTGSASDTEIIKPKNNWRIHETNDYIYYLIYENNLKFLLGDKSSLNDKLANNISKECKRKKKHGIIFATRSTLTSKMLIKIGLSYNKLPYDIRGL